MIHYHFFKCFHSFVSTVLLVVALSASLAVARSIECINQNWKYYRGNASGAEDPSYNDDSWSTVHLPHIFQYINYHFNSFYRGIGWYRKKITIDNAVQGKKVFLEFEGAMSVADVYINGTLVTTHKGGFLPFFIDITSHVDFGSENTIAVKLDNTYQTMVPPEKPDNGAVDYCLFGGIHRDVYLVVTEKLYIPHPYDGSSAPGGGTFITTPNVSTSSATVMVKTVVKNENTSAKLCVLKTIIRDRNGATVSTLESTQNIDAGSSYTFTQTTSPAISNPSLWSPTSPSLYKAYSEVYDNTTIVDTMSTRFGIRSIRFEKETGFYLNGSHLKLLGVNRHETFPYLGHALPNRGQYRDAKILKEMGCNFIRLSHYPQDPAFLDACDELGIALWEEVPTWMGWNFPQAWKDLHYQQIRDMIRRDRNHPCVLMWGIGTNEGDHTVDFETGSLNAANAEDTTHPTTTARNYQDSENPFDIYGNNYFEPPLPNSNPDASCDGYINSEHTGHTYPTKRYDDQSRQIEHSKRHEVMTDEACDRDWVTGTASWCGFDYNTLFNHENGIAYHGVSDLFRIPKFACYFYQSQAAADNYDGSKNPMVFIESFNTYSMPSTQTIKILSNCDQVELFVNGTSVGTRSPDGGTSLAHPPFTFSNVSYSSPGTLRADAKIGGTVVATHTLRRPGSAATVSLAPDTDTLLPDGADVARVVVSIEDDNGTLVRSASNTVSVSVQGPGMVICGPNGPETSGQITVEAGRLAFLVQAELQEGTIIVTADASGLTTGRDTIWVGQPTGVSPYGTLPVTDKAIKPILQVCKNSVVCSNLDIHNPAHIYLIAMNGRRIRTEVTTGRSRVSINLNGYPPGIYMIFVDNGTFTVQRKICLLK